MTIDDTLILLLGLSALVLFMIVGAIAADFLSEWRYNRRVKKTSDIHWLKRNTK